MYNAHVGTNAIKYTSQEAGCAGADVSGHHAAQGRLEGRSPKSISTRNDGAGAGVSGHHAAQGRLEGRGPTGRKRGRRWRLWATRRMNVLVYVMHNISTLNCMHPKKLAAQVLAFLGITSVY